MTTDSALMHFDSVINIYLTNLPMTIILKKPANLYISLSKQHPYKNKIPSYSEIKIL